ncbi:MAG: hypothetical protein IPL50_17310 [Chitinophagaceae bacterium]|nr:hypothetical protein [Chitinophagaceae bacterium]
MLQMIEKYSPDELNRITKIIVDQVPPDFTYEEAVVYQNDYYKALVNLKKNLKKRKTCGTGSWIFWQVEPISHPLNV